MRPLKLVMEAFGPFVGSQDLDFSLLGDKALFLIHGPTGAGKTTILDAMCFALYGDTSGGERDGRQMRSHYAGAEEVTAVSFEFALGREVYRIHRIPEQERPKKRGEGTTLQPAGATLWRRTGLEDSSREGTVLAAGWKDVTEQVEILLGFSSHQFRQVVVLPQGQFRQLLLADSRERQKILEKLFQVELFRRFEEFLKEGAKKLEREIEHQGAEKNWTLQQGKYESREALENGLASHLQELAELGKAIGEKNLAVEKVRTELSRGQQVMEKFQEREQAAGALAELKGKIPEAEAKKGRLQAAHQANGLAEVEKYLAEKRNAFSEAKRMLEEKEKAVRLAGETAAIAHQQLKDELEKEPERQKKQKQVLWLEGLEDKVKSLVEAEKNVILLEQKFTEGEKKQKEFKLKLEWLEKETEQLTGELDKGKEAGSQVQLLAEKKKMAEKLLERKKQLDELTRKLAIARQKYQNGEKETGSAGKRYEDLKKEVRKLQDVWNKGQAVVLAATLAAGEPCPVCGSPEHPVPAHPAGGLVPSEIELQTRQQDLQEAENGYSQAREKLGRLTVYLAETEQQGAALKEELAEKTGWEPAQFQGDLNKIGEELIKAEDLAGKITGLMQKLRELRGQESAIKGKLEQLDVYLKAQANRLAGFKAVKEELETGIPEKLRDTAALERAINEHKKILEAISGALEKARQNAQEASVLITKKETEYFNGKNQLEKAGVAFREAEKDFGRRLEKAGFSDEASYRKAKAPEEEVLALEQELQDFSNNLASVRVRFTQAEESVAGLEKPHLEVLEKALKDATDLQGELLSAKGRLTGLVEKEDGWLNKLKELGNSLAQFEKEYAVLGHLAQVANGKNRLGLTLQRFVLGVMLDDVTIAASARLKLMSRGRYQLQRTMERTHGKAAAGLDLEVFDNYTGKSRAVATLSGGESFLASLSLALGLADVVQAYAGGIHLDTIFVDEGFGTLDQETLDLAMKTLIDLQQGGRLVGIISHVTELKERIDARLEVRPQERGRGSRACFRLG